MNERIKQLFGEESAPEVFNYTLKCSACDRVQLTIERQGEGRVVKFNPGGVALCHIEGTIYRVMCPECALVESVDIPLPADHFKRINARSEPDDSSGWQPFGSDSDAM